MTTDTSESIAWLASSSIGAKRIINGQLQRVTQVIMSTGTLEIELDPTRTYDVIVNTNERSHIFEDVVGIQASRMDMNSTDPENRFSRGVTFTYRDGMDISQTMLSVFRFVVLERIELPSEAGSARVLVHDVVAE